MTRGDFRLFGVASSDLPQRIRLATLAMTPQRRNYGAANFCANDLTAWYPNPQQAKKWGGKAASQGSHERVVDSCLTKSVAKFSWTGPASIVEPVRAQETRPNEALFVTRLIFGQLSQVLGNTCLTSIFIEL